MFPITLYYPALAKREAGLSDRFRTFVHRTCLHFVKSVHRKVLSGGNWNFTTCYMTMRYRGYFWGQLRPKVNIDQFLLNPQFSSDWNLKRIFISAHWIQPPIISQVNRGQKINTGRISKIVNFHMIDLKFGEDLHIWSLNSTTNYFWGQICFMDFASIVLCTTSSSCFVITQPQFYEI